MPPCPVRRQRRRAPHGLPARIAASSGTSAASRLTKGTTHGPAATLVHPRPAASADGTWPLEDPYGEPGPGPAEQQDQQPAVSGPGSLGGGFVPAASYRMRRSPARPPAPRKARAARNTPLRPGRVLIAAALAGLAASAGIAATAGQPAIRLAPADNPAATSQYTPTIGPAATPSPAASSRTADAEPLAVSRCRRTPGDQHRRSPARPGELLGDQQPGQQGPVGHAARQDRSRHQLPDGRRGLPDRPRLRVHARHCAEPRLVDPAPASRDLPALVRGAGHLHRRRRRLPGLHPAAGGAPWKNVLEPYLLHGTGPGPFVTTDASGYAAQADPDAAGLAVTPAQIEEQTAASLDGAAAAVGNPGNLADMRDEAYFAAHLQPGSVAGDRHSPGGMVFAAQTIGGGALVFYSLTATVSLTPPPGQALEIGIPGYYTPARPQTSTVTIRYVEQFAAYLPPGHARAQLLADASGIAG